MSKLRRIAACAIALSVAVLLVDYAVASHRAPADDKLVAELRQQTQSDAAFALKLTAEQKRITAAHLARKTRDRAITWLMIVASVAFIVSSGRLVGRAYVPAAPVKDRKRQPSRPLKPPAAELKGPNRAQLRYRITEDCIGCTVCAQVCPKGAIAFRPYEKHVVDEALCKPCDMCRRVCQEDAVELVSG